MPCVSLLLSGVALHHLKCTTAAHWGVSMSFQVFHCHSLGWHCVILSVPFLLTGLFMHHPWCSTAINYGGST